MTRATIVWMLLILLTLATYLAGKFGYNGREIMALLMLSVFIKGHFVIADFMGLRHVKLLWRSIMHGWLIVITVFIGIAYIKGMGV